MVIGPVGWSGVNSGISHLEPSLFVKYINDMLDVVGSNIKMFAGNNKIYSIAGKKRTADPSKKI